MRIAQTTLMNFIHPRTAVLAGMLLLSTRSPAAPAEAAEHPVEYVEGMTPPAMISGTNPEYTQEAIEHGIEGTISLKCIVNAQGKVHGCEVQKSLPYMDRAVINAIQARKYRPALMQGKPVDVFYTFHVKLRLPDQ